MCYLPPYLVGDGKQRGRRSSSLQQRQQQLHHWNGRQQWRSSRAAPFVFASDASLRGFGFYLESAPTLSTSTADSESTPTLHASTVDSTAWPQHLRVGATFSGTYSAEHAHLHHSHTQIAWCELLAVVACASTYGPLLSGQSLLFHVDNSTDVHIINRQATRSRALAGLLRQLYSIALRYNLSIRAQHRPGDDNVLADFLSRPELRRHDHVAQWAATHPTASARLSSVSLVFSRHYVSSSTASPATPSDSTHASHTSRVSAPSAPFAPACTSTLPPRSPSSSYVASASSTPTSIASPAFPALCPPSPTTPCAWASRTYLEVARSTIPTEDNSTTCTHTPTPTATTTTTTTTTRPATRSTATPIHPFFIDLANRTGKAAKHFRRLYPPTTAICECGLFPVYTQQVRSPTSDPIESLPAPFRVLCLDCIFQIVDQYNVCCKTTAPPDEDKKLYWTRMYVPELQSEIWTRSMEEAVYTIYWSYYTNQQRKVIESAPITNMAAARQWIRRHQLQYRNTCLAMNNVLRDVEARGGGQKEAV